MEYLPAIEAENAKLRTSIGIRETCNAMLREDLEDQEGYDQMLRDRLRQQTELRVKAEAENAKLLKAVDYLYGFAKTLGVDADDLRELGIEVDGHGR